MAVKMRLRREGKRKQPYYRVVIADVRSPRDGRFVEDLGYYHPVREPSEISIDRERALHWLRSGAQPTQPVINLLRIEGIWQEFRPDDTDPHGERRRRRAAKRDEKKAAQKAAAQAEAEAQRKAEEEKAAADAAQADDVAEQAREEVEQPPADQPTGSAADEVSAANEPTTEDEEKLE
jgi:small subunit ribosomal protein S16